MPVNECPIVTTMALRVVKILNPGPQLAVVEAERAYRLPSWLVCCWWNPLQWTQVQRTLSGVNLSNTIQTDRLNYLASKYKPDRPLETLPLEDLDMVAPNRYCNSTIGLNASWLAQYWWWIRVNLSVICTLNLVSLQNDFYNASGSPGKNVFFVDIHIVLL